MGKVFGKVTDAVGLTDYAGEERAANRAEDANLASIALSKEQIALQKETLEFQKDQYQDWKDIYGDLQENLGDYYNELNPDDVIAMGLQNQQMEFQKAVDLIEVDAARRGISGSGLEYAETSRATFQNAEARARIRSTGERAVAEEKMSFLGLGLGQGTQMLGMINQASSNANNAYSTGVNSRGNAMSNYLSQQTQFSLQNQATSNELFGTALGFATGGA